MDALNIKHILVPIDFSAASLNAMDTAVAMTKRHDAKLTLLHVVNESILSYHHADVLPIASAVPIVEMMRNEAKEMLGQIKDKVTDKHGIEVQGETTQGFVSSEICKSAERLGADLVVMGTHGASGFREFFMGTNAYAVVKHAPCPVLTVPPNGKWESFSKILFPVRDTPGALEKYDFLRKIIRQNNAVLHLLGIPDTSIASSENWVEKNIQKLKGMLRDDNVECLTQLLKPTERVAEEVLYTAKMEQTDLIAITATLDFNIRDFFIGPYTQQIVNHARVPVLSIRPAKLPDTAQKTVQIMRTDYGPMLPGLNLPLRTSLHLNVEMR
ncbi:MAG TPA: universal stress protein [Saprospiraceae bacterium]|nr:universal stress protein [Saprospiraceae bacterium]